MRLAKKTFKTVTMTIVQPVHGVNRSHTMTVSELLQWERNVLIPAAQAAMAPDPKVVPSESACEWCPARAICPAHIETFTELAEAALPQALSNEQLASYLNQVSKVEAFIKALETYAVKCIKDGAAVPGWQMGSVGALVLAGLTQDQIYPKEIISPAVAEKLLNDKTVTETLTTKVSSGLTLCRAFGIGE